MMYLEVMSGPMDGHRWKIDADVVHIGSGSAADVVIPHDRVIRAEGVVLRRRGAAFELADGSAIQEIAGGELFQVGCTWLRVLLR